MRVTQTNIIIETGQSRLVGNESLQFLVSEKTPREKHRVHRQRPTPTNNVNEVLDLYRDELGLHQAHVDMVRAVRLQGLSEVANIEVGRIVTAPDVVGGTFWNLFLDHERPLVGRIFAWLVVTGQLPLQILPHPKKPLRKYRVAAKRR